MYPILGSFPSVKSREEGFFYGHPQNRFWKVLAAIFNENIPQTIQEKKEFFANPVTQAAARISGCRNIVPAKRLSAHQLEVPDWGICFELEKEIPEDISFVGVRAHYIEVSADLEPAKNSSIMQMDRLLEQQFESELVLKYNQDTMSLRILMDKEQAEQLAAHEKLRVTIPEHALLLLKA